VRAEKIGGGLFIGCRQDRQGLGAGGNGKLHEKVYDAAWPGDRKPGKNAHLPAVGNTVNLK
jgi:hypothetical protein